VKNKVYLAVADNLSKLKAYEYADELGLEIAGQSGYIDDATDEISAGGIDSVICSQKLLDGQPRQLFDKLPSHLKRKCDFYVVTPINSATYKLKKASFGTLCASRDKVAKMLDYLKMPQHLDGRVLFEDALQITLASPNALSNMMREVYRPIAKIHGITVDSVEFNMRTARDTSLLRCDPDIVYEIFGNYPDGRAPSVSMCLSMLTSYIIKTM